METEPIYDRELLSKPLVGYFQDAWPELNLRVTFNYIPSTSFQYLKGWTEVRIYELATEFDVIYYMNRGHYQDCTFPADHLLSLRFACDRHHLHQQPVSSLPDQRHHLLMSQLNDIHAIYLRQGRSTRRGRVRRFETLGD